MMEKYFSKNETEIGFSFHVAYPELFQLLWICSIVNILMVYVLELLE